MCKNLDDFARNKGILERVFLQLFGRERHVKHYFMLRLHVLVRLVCRDGRRVEGREGRGRRRAGAEEGRGFELGGGRVEARVACGGRGLGDTMTYTKRCNQKHFPGEA